MSERSLVNKIAEGLAPVRPLPRFMSPAEIDGLSTEARGLETSVRSILHEYQNRLGDKSLEMYNDKIKAERKGAIRRELDERLAGPVDRLREIRMALDEQREHYSDGAVSARAAFAAVAKDASEYLAFKNLFESADSGELVELVRFVTQASIGRYDLALIGQRTAERHGGAVQDVVQAIVRGCPRPQAETSTGKRLESLIAEVDLILLDAEALRGANVAHKRLEAAFRRGGLGNPAASAVAS